MTKERIPDIPPEQLESLLEEKRLDLKTLEKAVAKCELKLAILEEGLAHELQQMLPQLSEAHLKLNELATDEAEEPSDLLEELLLIRSQVDRMLKDQQEQSKRNELLKARIGDLAQRKKALEKLFGMTHLLKTRLARLAVQLVQVAGYVETIQGLEGWREVDTKERQPKPDSEITVSGRAPAERRRAPRVTLIVEVSLASEHNFFVGVSGNISSGGIFVATYDQFEIGQVVDVEFTLPNMQNPLSATGQVAWQRPYSMFSASDVPGIGVEFSDVSQEALTAIEEFTSQRPSYFYDG